MHGSKIKQYINTKYSIKDAWVFCFGNTPPSGKCYCPFHKNTDSPAAKVYEEFNILKCFSYCNRSYTAYDLLKAYRPDIIQKEKLEGVIKVETKKCVELKRIDISKYLDKPNRYIYKICKNITKQSD